MDDSTSSRQPRQTIFKTVGGDFIQTNDEFDMLAWAQSTPAEMVGADLGTPNMIDIALTTGRVPNFDCDPGASKCQVIAISLFRQFSSAFIHITI